MESFLSAYGGSSTQAYNYNCARYNGDNAIAKFKTRLQEKVSQKKRTPNPFGASYHRGTRLRALSDLEKVQIPRRRQTVTNDPKADLHHEEHASYVNNLLHDLDDHTQSNTLPIVKVAADDNLLLCRSRETLVETLTEHISLQHVAYAFDLSTFLIHRLDLIIHDPGHASQSWRTYNADCKRLKDEKYIANLLHLLRRLQYFLFQILIHKSLKRLDDLHDNWQKRDSRQEGKSLDADWFSEWPSGERPLSTTWPWNIRPSLIVLWGVCWMFYPSEQGNSDNSYRVPAQHIHDSSNFMESWAQNFSQTDLDEAANIRLNNESMLAYSQATDDAALSVQAANNYEARDANFGRRSSAPAAPHLTLQDSLATQHFTPPSHAGINTSHPSQLQALVAPNARQHVGSNAYNYGNPAFAGTPESRDLWLPATSGGNISYAFPGHDNTNVFPPSGYHTPISQAQSFFPQQTTSADLPTLEVSPINGPNHFPNIDTPTPTRQALPRRALFIKSRPSNMGVNDAYPISPQSERHRSTSIPTSASPNHSLITSPVMSTSHSPQTSESSARHRVSVQRTQEPPRNENDEIYCNHEECGEHPPIFRRRCEWNKHMDKHERPYKCTESGCEKLQGFTYSGGLLRHQREVHKKNGTAKATLFCPDPNCNRHTGQGFTRKENLNEHIRRRHVAQPSPVGQQSSPMTAISKAETFASHYEAGASRKRKRTMDTEVLVHEEEDEGDADDAEFDDSGLADAEEREEVSKRIKVESEEHDTHLHENRKLKDENARLLHTLQQTQAMLLERDRALTASLQKITELERRLVASSGRLMTAPPHA